MDAVRLISVATASPAHQVAQTDAAAAAREVLGDRYRDFDRLYPVFASSGVVRRQTIMPMDWYRQNRDWPERTKVYVEGAVDLFVAAAGKALDRAGLVASDVDAIVTVSSTGIATPSLEARAMGRMGFRSDIGRAPIFGLGCAGGVTGLSLASRLARARPGSLVLMVCVELCTLAFSPDEFSPANVIATALFGDGAAACVVGSGHAGSSTGLWAIDGAGEHTWPDTLDIMGWRVGPEGFGVIFDRSIPAFVVANIRQALHGIVTGMGMDPGTIDRFVCHPGGAKVLVALETALGLASGALDHERQVLAEHGNMSAPTVFFVLERVLAHAPPPRLVLSALGPGFTASCVSLAG